MVVRSERDGVAAGHQGSRRWGSLTCAALPLAGACGWLGALHPAGLMGACAPLSSNSFALNPCAVCSIRRLRSGFPWLRPAHTFCTAGAHASAGPLPQLRPASLSSPAGYHMASANSLPASWQLPAASTHLAHVRQTHDARLEGSHRGGPVAKRGTVCHQGNPISDGVVEAADTEEVGSHGTRGKVGGRCQCVRTAGSGWREGRGGQGLMWVMAACVRVGLSAGAG